MLKTAISLVALALLSAPAQAQDTPAPPPGLSPELAATQAAQAEQEDPLPRGAPSDDYEFVGWCSGALSTHMELYTRVRSELEAISIRWNTLEEDNRTYAAQQIAGRSILAGFDRAMRAAEAASTRNLAPDGRRAIQSGVAMWNQLSGIDARNQAYSWMNWELPERCMRIAGQLESRSLANSALLRSSGAAAISASSTPSSAPIVNPEAPQTTAPTPDPFQALGSRLR